MIEDGERRREAQGTRLMRLVLIGLAYFATALGSVLLTREAGNVATLWIADSIAIAAILLCRRADWQLLTGLFVIASVAANLIFGDSLAASLFLTLANAANITVAVALVRRWSNLRTVFLRPDRLTLLIVAVGLVAPLAGATVGASVAVSFEGASFAAVWPTWFLADAVGALVMLPMIAIATLVRRYGTSGLLTVRSREEMIALCLAVVIASLGVFLQTRMPLLFVIIPFVLLATIRLGPLGAASATLIVGVIGAAASSADMGPVALIAADHGARVQFFQFFLATVFVSALPVGAFLGQRDRLATQLAAREAQYRTVVDAVEDVIFRTDAKGRWTFLNPAWKRLTGRTPADTLRDSFLHAIHPDDRQQALANLAPLYAKAITECRQRLRYVHADGSLRWVAALSQLTLDDAGEIVGTFGTLRDITERKELEERLTHEAATDALTGLLNRRAFIERVDAERAARSTTTLAMLDIDHFKAVNDTHGHPAGDTVLRAFAGICRAAAGPEAVIGRIGGEEFGVLLAGHPLPEAEAILEKLRAAIQSARIDIGDREIGITASIGATEVEAGPTASEFLNRADKALYEAKNAGRNRLRLAA